MANENDPAITPLDIERAYRFSKLRMIGIGFVRAIETPQFYKALCATARAMKKRQQEIDRAKSQGMTHMEGWQV